MSDLNEELPEVGTETGDGNVNVPDSTGTEQVPDTVPEPVPMPDPENKDIEDKPLPPGPLLGPSGFSLR